MSRIAVIGAGYVGLTSAACLAHLGHDVVCGDLDEDRVRRLRKAEVPILERHLPVLVAEGLESGRLTFVVGAASATADAEFVFLCVATPQGDDGSADLTYLDAAVAEIAPVLSDEAVVITKSTAPVGTARRVLRILEASGAPPGVRVASNPEFFREGESVHDFMSPDRIVVGCDDAETAVRLTGLYRGVPAPVIVTDPASAEMIKYASNSYLATRVSFVNALANLCEAVGADVKDVVLGMGHDSRIGSKFLQPGPGYGGSCLPKDTAALLHIAESAGCSLPPLVAAVEVNERQREVIVDKIERAVGGDWKGSVVAVWGLTFKANTDDLRDSPALDIAGRLLQRGARVRAYDPAAGAQAASVCPGLEVVEDPYVCTDGAGVLAILTEWEEFRWLDFGRVRDSMASPRIVDARNLLDASSLRRHGFDYTGVGR